MVLGNFSVILCLILIRGYCGGSKGRVVAMGVILNGVENSYRCSCNNRLTMLMKLAIENTDIDKEVSFNIASRGCVRWYKKVRVYIPYQNV